jgi:uncharacterized protein YhdP
LALGLTGGEAAPMPDTGVLGNVRLDVLDLDAWQGVARRLLPVASVRATASGAAAAAGAGREPTGAVVLDTYLPTVLGLRASEVRGGGRVLKGVVLGGSRTGSLWRATVEARELNGYVEADWGAGGDEGARVKARLSRLQVPRSLVGDVQQLLEQAPELLPALDIVADAFEWNGRAMGRLVLEGRPVATLPSAVSSRMRAPLQDWVLHRLVLGVPEATVQATGRWRPPGPLVALTGGAARRGDMELELHAEVVDAGALLHRLGMEHLVRAGKGRVQGRLGWNGSPLSPDYPSMRGHLALDFQAGQFLRAEPGVARLLGILSLQSLPRRLALDFRDVFNEGFRFDTASGQANIKDGVAHFDGVRIKGIAAAVAVEGSADLVRETQQLHVMVVPDLNAGTASLLTAFVNPAMGLSTLLAQTLLSQPLSQAASQELVVDGTWSEPRVTRVDRTGAGAPEEPVQ